MIQTLLNLIQVKYGTYTAEGHKIRRTFSNGFSYIVEECKSSAESQRIANDLNYLANK
jgi:ABC-type uncharacterized transport system ATPase subunit